MGNTFSQMPLPNREPSDKSRQITVTCAEEEWAAIASVFLDMQISREGALGNNLNRAVLKIAAANELVHQQED